MSLLLLVVTFILLVIAVHVCFPKTYHWPSTWRKINKIPGPKSWPFLGNTLSVMVSNEEFIPLLENFAKQYGSIWKISVLGHIFVFLIDLDDLEIILNSKNHITKGVDYEFLVPWLGTGLLISTGEKWFNHRKWLTPAFHFTILEQYVSIMCKNANILCDILSKHGEDVAVEINPLISRCSLDIICETAMGTEVNSQLGGEKDYVNSVLRISQIFTKRTLSPWLCRTFMFNLFPIGREHNKLLKVAHAFTERIIKERQAIYREKQRNKNLNLTEDSGYFGGKEKISFLDLLIEMSETQNRLTDEEIREEVDTFMFEGHDTTAAAITWALFQLGLHPDVQQTAYEEQQRIFGDSNRGVSFSDLQEMKYLERVIKETLRLMPSVPIMSRRLEENVKIGKYELPKGIQIPVFVYYIHRNPAIYPEPEKFNPDRFLPENMRDRHPYSYIPFSAGPRNCIGQKFAMMEGKVVLSNVIRNFKITTVDNPDDVKLVGEIILRSKENLRIKFAKR